jgi:hypothetical protein
LTLAPNGGESIKYLVYDLSFEALDDGQLGKNMQYDLQQSGEG